MSLYRYPYVRRPRLPWFVPTRRRTGSAVWWLNVALFALAYLAGHGRH